jgi:3-oxoacid CoA-transferase subunit A
METSKDDILVILGDAGINYFGNNHAESDPRSDYGLKQKLSELPITMFCIHGNHEIRPENIGSYEETIWNGGSAYWEPEFPYLLFAKDGEVYELAGKHCMAIGGAYSVDKEYRLMHGYGWWPDEQPSDEIKRNVKRRLSAEKWQIDVVFSHTCPYNYVGQVVPFIYPNVDNSTEKWLDKIEGKLSYSHWYCGHFHVEKTIGKMQFIYKDFTAL